jgi:hypothetical protein
MLDIRSSIPGMDRIISFHSIQTDSVDNLISCSVKQPEHDSELSSPSNDEVKNARSFISVSP